MRRTPSTAAILICLVVGSQALPVSAEETPPPAKKANIDYQAKSDDGASISIKQKGEKAAKDGKSVSASLGPIDAQVSDGEASAKIGVDGKVIGKIGGEASVGLVVKAQHDAPTELYPEGALHYEASAQVKGSVTVPTATGTTEIEAQVDSKPTALSLGDRRAEAARLQKAFDAADPDGMSRPPSAQKPPESPVDPRGAQVLNQPLASDPAIVISCPHLYDASEWRQEVKDLEQEFVQKGRKLELTVTDEELRIRQADLTSAEIIAITKRFRFSKIDLGHQKWKPDPPKIIAAAPASPPAIPVNHAPVMSQTDPAGPVEFSWDSALDAKLNQRLSEMEGNGQDSINYWTNLAQYGDFAKKASISVLRENIAHIQELYFRPDRVYRPETQAHARRVQKLMEAALAKIGG